MNFKGSFLPILCYDSMIEFYDKLYDNKYEKYDKFYDKYKHMLVFIFCQIRLPRRSQMCRQTN